MLLNVAASSCKPGGYSTQYDQKNKVPTKTIAPRDRPQTHSLRGSVRDGTLAQEVDSVCQGDGCVSGHHQSLASFAPHSLAGQVGAISFSAPSELGSCQL